MRNLTRAEEIKHKVFETRMIARLEQWIKPSLNERGFKISYTNPLNCIAIYESPQCRIRFQLREDQYQPEKDLVSVAYGRLRSPNDGDFIEKDGKSYKRAWCTIRRDQILDFLDGNDPINVAKLWAGRATKQLAWRKVYTLAESLDAPNSFVFELFFHEKIWQLYSKKLFDLFDRKNEKEWEAFRNFLEDYYMEWDYLRPDRSILRSYGDELYPWDID